MPGAQTSGSDRAARHAAILAAVCDAYDVSTAELTGTSRTGAHLAARMGAIALLTEAEATPQEIGSLLGGRTAATIRRNQTKLEEASASDPEEVARRDAARLALAEPPRDPSEAASTPKPTPRPGRASRDRAPRPPRPPELLHQLVTHRLERPIRADRPMVLISQPTRSGGTLLSQLFDGHPQLHVHPYEIEFGYPRKSVWPKLDPDESPKVWFSQLREEHTSRLFDTLYTKNRPARRLGLDAQLEQFPFVFVEAVQRSIFLRLVRQRPIVSNRDILECYLDSYFSAWLDYQNAYGDDKRWVVAFRSNLGIGKASKAVDFFADYPDGGIISCVRDPLGWTASKLAYQRPSDAERPAFITKSIEQWCQNGAGRISAKETYGDRIHLVRFADLLTDPTAVMTEMARWLAIDMNSCLTMPTFNSMPIKANSSFVVKKPGIIRTPLKSWRRVLTDAEAAQIREGTALVARALERLVSRQSKTALLAGAATPPVAVAPTVSRPSDRDEASVQLRARSR